MHYVRLKVKIYYNKCGGLVSKVYCQKLIMSILIPGLPNEISIMIVTINKRSVLVNKIWRDYTIKNAKYIQIFDEWSDFLLLYQNYYSWNVKITKYVNISTLSLYMCKIDAYYLKDLKNLKVLHVTRSYIKNIDKYPLNSVKRVTLRSNFNNITSENIMLYFPNVKKCSVGMPGAMRFGAFLQF